MKKLILVAVALFLITVSATAFYIFKNRPDVVIETRNAYNNSFYVKKPENIVEEKPAETVTEKETLQPLEQKLIPNNYHIFQTFNNCGPASLSMLLSYYGIEMPQKELGGQLRPYQNPKGDNDDKSVTMKEMENKARELGFEAYTRPGGTTDMIELFISNNIPVITKTWLKEDEDIGHFRVIKGFDHNNKTLTQDDSLQGKNLVYSYEDFDKIWEKYNHEYLVIFKKDKESVVKQIMGENINEQYAWEQYVTKLADQLEQSPNDYMSRFNLAVAYYNTGEYENSVREYEKVKDLIPKRAIWYHIEPIRAYFELKSYDTVLEISDEILNNGNRAFSELYILRGKIYEEQGSVEKAKEEYEKAVFYNTGLKESKDLLEKISKL